MKPNLFILFLSLLLGCALSSCNRMLMLAYGIRNPAPQTDAAIIASLKRSEVAYDQLYRVRDSASYASLKAHTMTLHEVDVYDRNGNCFQSAGGKSCGYELTRFDLHPDRYAIAPAARSEEVLLQPFTLIDSMPGHNYRYTMYLTWAVYTPKLNRSAFKVWREQQARSRQPIRYVLINLDIPDDVRGQGRHRSKTQVVRSRNGSG